ncbi:hypothetical protein [Moorena sp. SIO3H5]|nr:hypothetical protein [Moorena sp. SIO3H5]
MDNSLLVKVSGGKITTCVALPNFLTATPYSLLPTPYSLKPKTL